MPEPVDTKPTETEEPTVAVTPHVVEEFKAEKKDIEFDGYKFTIDTDLIDDVDVLDMIDAIENQQKPKVIVDFLKFVIGDEGYANMKQFFVARDGRFRLSKLSGVYQVIFENFDPKG